MADGERGRALGLDRLDVGTDAARSDHRDRDAGGPRRCADLVRVPLRVPVAEDEHGIGIAPEVVGRGIDRLRRPRTRLRGAEEPRRVIRRMPARAGSDEADAASAQLFRDTLDRGDVTEQALELRGLPPDCLLHLARRCGAHATAGYRRLAWIARAGDTHRCDLRTLIEEVVLGRVAASNGQTRVASASIGRHPSPGWRPFSSVT